MPDTDYCLAAGEPLIVPEPLVKADSPERAKVMAGYHASLLECIHIINTRTNEPLGTCLPDLIHAASGIADLLDDSVNSILSLYHDARSHPFCCCPPPAKYASRDFRPPPPERRVVNYHNPLERTLQVAALNRSLLYCISEITRRKNDRLRNYLDDLIDIAWEIALTLSHCVEENMGSDDLVPVICSECRGEIIRG